MDLISSLNPQQQEAVLHTHGPLLVMAGAGSGKTKALTHRIAYMMGEKKISPWNILAVTFTNKAAQEMKERIVKLVFKDSQSTSFDAFAFYNDDQKAGHNLPSIGTFHATCVRMLRKHIDLLGYSKSFVIYDTADQQIVMKHVLEELQIDPKKINPRNVLGYISNAKNQLIGPQEYHRYVNNYFTEQVAKAYGRYQEELQKASALDFDDLIMKTVELLQQEAQVLDTYQDRFQFISVDEYQDTNHAQYVLTNLLSQKYRNLCVIGDSDQSIYSFRGANIQNILDFEKDYPDAKVVLLEQNYRSTQPILDVAHSIIIRNSRRKDKKLWTDRDGGEKIALKILENERYESEFVGREIQKRLLNYEYPEYRDFVVLYRTNAQSRVVEETFLRLGIPYKIVGGIRFYERKEVKDMLAYLRVIQNPSDTVSLLRIINTPPRKIGSRTLEILQSYALQHNVTLFGAMEQAENITELRGEKTDALLGFAKLIRELQKANREFSASGVIKHVLDYTGYRRFLDDGTDEGQSRLENIYELISVASKYDSLEPQLSLSIFLEEVSLISDLDNVDTQDNAVTLMTIHSAKGLEFPVVFLIGMEEGILPHSRSVMDLDALEEERRLMYVAVTRAKDKLYILRARHRLLYGAVQTNAASQFLDDIPPELLEGDENLRQPGRLRKEDLGFTPVPVEEYSDEPAVVLEHGDRVMHTKFGLGTVKLIQGGVATIVFDDLQYGTKKLALSIAPLKKVND